MLCVVSIVDSISATSMPVNEFVIYRSTHGYPIHQILIVCDNKTSDVVNIPNNVKVYLVGNSSRKVRAAVSEIKKDYKDDAIVYHMHHQKSALLFMRATIGMGIRKSTLYTVHSTFSARNIKYKISSCVCVLLSNYANCVSASAFAEYASWVKIIKRKKFISIANGVDIDRIDSSIVDDLPVTDRRKKLICVGRMVPLKNHEFLIKLMVELPDYKLVLVGAEDPEEKIRKLAQKLNVIDRIEFTGLISREEVFRKLGSASIYLSASYIEGLPVSVLEAMRVGLIPIISDIMPHREISEMCKEVVVLPFQPKLWKDAIKYIDELSEQKYIIESEKIKKSVKKNFSLDKMHEYYMKVYKQLN